MREILFKAYQRFHKRMLPVIGITFHKGEVESVTVNNSGCNGEYSVIPLLTTYRIEHGDFPLESLIIMQYTGLTDKNGTKIFEGDIVKYNVYKHKFIGAVVFDKCHFLARGTDVNYRLTRLPSNANIEVVGNIYDNPELIQ